MAFRYYKPSDRVNKLNEYFGLIDSLFQHEKGFTEMEFLHRIDATKGTNSPDSGFIFQQLLNYRLIVESNDYEPRYSLALPYREFLEYLYQESQPVNSAVIQGYIGALEQRINDLKRAYEEGSEALALRFLKRLGREIENIGQTSSRNRLGVVSEVRKLKQNDEKLSYKERLSESNRLWDEYLEPLREMIAPSGSFGIVMEQLKQILEIGERKFNGQTELRQLFRQSRAARVQLNEQTRLDLNEAQQELMPLREKLAQESKLVDAAGIIFSSIEQGHLNDLPAFPFGRILRRERHISLTGLRPYLAELWSLDTEPDSIFQEEAPTTEPAPLETEAIIDMLDNMDADTDVIEYFLSQHQHLTPNEVLRAVSIVCLHQQRHNVDISEEHVEYLIGNQRWQGIRILKKEHSSNG